MRDDYQTPSDPFTENDYTDAGERRAVLLRLLRGRWHWAILLALLLSVAGGYLVYNSQPEKYEAASTIEIKQRYYYQVDLQDLTLEEPYAVTVNRERNRIKSQEVIESAMSQPEWQQYITQRPAHLPKITLDSFADSIYIEEPEQDETTMYIGFIDQDPEATSVGINAVLTAYRDFRAQIDVSESIVNKDLLEQQLADLRGQAETIEGQIEAIVSDEDQQLIRARLSAKMGELANTQYRLNQLELELQPYINATESQQQSGQPLTPQEIRDLMLQSPDMVLLLDQKVQFEDILANLLEVQNRGEQHPDVIRTRQLISRVDRQIAEFENNWSVQDHQRSNNFPAEIAQAMSVRQGMLTKITELTAVTTEIAAQIAAIEDYQLELTDIRTAIRNTNEEIRGAQSTSDLRDQNDRLSRVQIGDFAQTPLEPYNASKRRQLAGIGGIGGFFLGFGLVMAVSLFDRRLRHVSDTTYGIPDTNVLGILPTLPADLRDPEDAETAAHCVHHIRTLLQISGSNRVFSITSPSAGSGKSSLATALGMSFAASGVRTLVIDADLVGAGLSRRMGTIVHEPLDTIIRRNSLLGEAELSRAMTQATAKDRRLDEVLLQENLMDQEQIETALRLQRDTSLGLLDACAPSRLRACVAASGMTNFFILPVGKARPADASRLSPAAMRELIRQAREAFDIVLIDTGPVLGSIEASIAAAEADATVMIVSRGDQKSLAARSIEQLRSVRANISGIVFNHALDSDLAHTSYASIVSQERRPARDVRKRKLDKTRSARLGPLGTAVASFSGDDEINGVARTNGTAQDPDFAND